ncbi:class E sortase [Streptomyces sp. NPDC059687]|uniref:class E sortase n=1 Tax=Streptomyces sp. NPDC059687 TaxID=3346905 RepID=UPI0036CB7E2B
MRIPVVHHAALRRRAVRHRFVRSGGELLVTAGVVLMLLVVHQLWWTNREARQGAERKVRALEREWGGPEGPSGSGDIGAWATSDAVNGTAGTPPQRRHAVAARPGRSRAYAVLAVPRLSLRAPVAEGVSKTGVLDKGYVGHYPGTAQPGRAGNFAVAGHRNSHGEPFRHLDRLRPGDSVVVETRSTTYTYVVDQVLPRTSAADGGVIAPVPRSRVSPSHGYDRRGHYLTLTTCTPQFTSRYRLVVWGVLASARPR